MKAFLTRASNQNQGEIIDVNSIDDLLKICDDESNEWCLGKIIINRQVRSEFKGLAEFTVIIYDDYME
jgi:hypothetical protein